MTELFGNFGLEDKTSTPSWSWVGLVVPALLFAVDVSGFNPLWVLGLLLVECYLVQAPTMICLSILDFLCCSNTLGAWELLDPALFSIWQPLLTHLVHALIALYHFYTLQHS